jgi:hypothetical protein
MNGLKSHTTEAIGPASDLRVPRLPGAIVSAIVISGA